MENYKINNENKDRLFNRKVRASCSTTVLRQQFLSLAVV